MVLARKTRRGLALASVVLSLLAFPFVIGHRSPDVCAILGFPALLLAGLAHLRRTNDDKIGWTGSTAVVLSLFVLLSLMIT